MSADSKKYFLILLGIYFLVRIPLLFSNQLLSDELDIGAIANEFATKAPHLPIPLLDYQKRPYAVTSLLDAAFAAPFFLLFGSTLFALKLASLVWYIFPLIAWWFVWRDEFSPKKTFFILLFFVLSPEMVFYSLTYGHQHLETMLWMALSFILYRRFLSGKWGEVPGGLLLGLFGGLICSLSLANGVALALLCLHLFFLKETKIRKAVFFGVAIPVFLLGVSPLIIYNINYNMSGYFAMQEIFTRMDTSSGHFFQRFIWVFSEGIPGLFVFKKFSAAPKFILTGFFTFSYLFSFVYLAWKKRKSLLTFQGDRGFDIVAFGLAYQMLFIALALASNRIYGKELFFPIVPFIGMTLFLGASRFSGVVGAALKNRFRTGLVLFCAMGWILGDLSLVRFKKLGEAFHIKGYSYTLLTQHLACRFNAKKNSTVFQKKLKMFLEGRTAENKRQLAFAALGCLLMEQASSKEFLLSIHEADEEIQPIFYEHFGRSLGKTTPANIKLHPEIYRGFISSLSSPSHTLCIQASPQLKPACYEGLGLNANLVSIYSDVEEKYRSSYLLGLGKQTVWNWLHGFFEPAGIINQLEQEEWNRFDTAALNDFFASLNPDEKKWFNRGIKEASSLLVEDDFLRERVLKKLILL